VEYCHQKLSAPLATSIRLKAAQRDLNACIILWLLKNSLFKKQRKLDRVRMPYKQFVGAA
jgi:hypothetical protein